MPYDTVIVGYDGSAAADRAVDAAIELVSSGGTVHVVTAFHPDSSATLTRHLSAIPEEFRYVYDPLADEEERQAPALHRIRDAGASCVAHVVADDPAGAILDVAAREGADLVVVGSRGFGAVQRFLRGSVSSRIATHAPTSVLVVHDDAAPTHR